MGVLFSRYKSNIFSLKAISLAAFILLICAVVSIVRAPSAMAVDAAWTSGTRDVISYGGQQFRGPNTNRIDGLAWTGWTPSDMNTESDATFYTGDNAVIWFPKGVNKDSAANAKYSKIKRVSQWGQGQDYFTLENTTDISIGLDQTESALSVVKSVYKNSISDYVNSECSKPPFTQPNNQRECRDIVNKQFDECWKKVTNADEGFTFSSSKPGSSIDRRVLASCIASSTDVGTAANYDKRLSAAQDKANKDGAAAYNNAQPTGEIPEGEAEASCRIDGVGWILCPVMSLAGGLIDGAYEVVAKLLTVQPILTTTTSGEQSAIFKAWSMMRNFANVAFVIAFLVIVFSQVTGMGISNYGIKKAIPRLIFAAIFVNISFWVCAIAVDASNVAGTSLKSLFDSMGGSFASPNASGWTTGNGWQGIVGGVVAGAVITGAALYMTLSALLPALVAALIAIITVFLVLTLRQALIILLIVVSPLAFVAFLLPNTQGWFNKWRQLFQTMLFMFPIIAVIFGASAFASQIVMESAAEDDFAVQIMGALISIIPLAITPVVMKTAGGLLNRFAGIVNNPNKGPLDRLKRGAEGIRDHRQALAKNRRIGRGEQFRNGQMFNGKLGSKLYGKEGSYRRRGMAALGAYGRNQRELGRKDVAAGLEAGNEQVYLRSDAGTAKRQASANASIELQNTKTNVETSRLASEAGQALAQATTQADLEKKIAENIGQTKAKVNVPMDLQMRAMATSDDMKAVDTNFGQLYEEIKVENSDPAAPKHALYNQVSDETRALAQDAQRKTDVANDATSSAKRVQRLEYADAINSSDRLAAMSGGIDPYGSQRAKAQATVMQDKAIDEAVSNEKATMGAIGTNEISAAIASYPKLALQDTEFKKGTKGVNAVNANDVLASIRDDTNLSMERRIAAQSKLVDAANAKDMVNHANDLSAMLNTANTNLASAKASGDTAQIATAQIEVNTAIHLQKQLFSDGAGKLPTSVTGATKGALANGSYTGNMDNEVLSKLKSGAYSGAGLASMSPHEVKWVADVISKNSSNPEFQAMGEKLRDDIVQHKAASASLGKAVAPEVGDAMDTIRISF